MSDLGFSMDSIWKWALAVGLFAAQGCGSEPAKGSSITAMGGSGGGGGSGGAPQCLTFCAQGQFTLATQIDGECVVHCGQSSMGTSSPVRGSFDDGELFFETSSAVEVDAGAPVDGGTSASVEYALVRLPDEGPLGGHWLCAATGSVEPAADGMGYAYALSQLSDLGPCEGDASSPDAVSLSQTSGSSPTLTGSIDNVQIVNGASIPSCSSQRCEISMQRQAGQTAGVIVVRTEEPMSSTTATPVAVAEAAWIAPRHLDYDLICAGPGSTIARSSLEGATELELVGLRKKTCPGTPLPGTIQGKLSTDPETAGGT